MAGERCETCRFWNHCGGVTAESVSTKRRELFRRRSRRPHPGGHLMDAFTAWFGANVGRGCSDYGAKIARLAWDAAVRAERGAYTVAPGRVRYEGFEEDAGRFTFTLLPAAEADAPHVVGEGT